MVISGCLFQFDVPGGSVRYVLITEDVVNGKLAPFYFGRDGKVGVRKWSRLMIGTIS